MTMLIHYMRRVTMPNETKTVENTGIYYKVRILTFDAYKIPDYSTYLQLKEKGEIDDS